MGVLLYALTDCSFPLPSSYRDTYPTQTKRSIHSLEANSITCPRSSVDEIDGQNGGRVLKKSREDVLISSSYCSKINVWRPEDIGTAGCLTKVLIGVRCGGRTVCLARCLFSTLCS